MKNISLWLKGYILHDELTRSAIKRVIIIDKTDNNTGDRNQERP